MNEFKNIKENNKMSIKNVIIDGKDIEITGQVSINHIGFINEGIPIYEGGVLKRIEIRTEGEGNRCEITIPFRQTLENEALIRKLNMAGVDQKNYKMIIQFDGVDWHDVDWHYEYVCAKQGYSIEVGSNTIKAVLECFRVDK